MGKESEISKTEDRIQTLLAQLLEIVDEEERTKTLAEINRLKNSAEGKADLKRQEEMVRDSLREEKRRGE